MGLDINETKFVNKVKERLKLKLETIREIKFTILSIFLIFLPTYTKEKKEGRSSVLIIIVFWSLFYILLLNNQHSLVGSRNKPSKGGGNPNNCFGSHGHDTPERASTFRVTRKQ